MKENNKHKIAIITGGTGALGRHVVDKFAEVGWKVYIPVQSLKVFMQVFDNSQDENSSFSLRKIYAFECNALNENDVIEFVRNTAALEKGRIDVLVNTIGGFPGEKGIDSFTTEEFDEMFDLNFRTTFWFSREVLKYMKERNYGRISCISSIAALDPMPKRFSYSVSKSAIVTLMETINYENPDSNIKCNAIIPTVIDTPANREWGSEEEIKKWIKPQEIADRIYSLADKDEPTIIKMGN